MNTIIHKLMVGIKSHPNNKSLCYEDDIIYEKTASKSLPTVF